MLNNKKTSYIRLLHAAPKAPAVDVIANEEIVLTESLEFGEFTPYIPVQPGEYKIDVFPANTTDKAVYTTTLNIPEKKILTVAVIGTLPNLEALIIDDVKEEIPEGNLGLRFVHLSPNAPAVDIRLPNGDILFKDISYKEIPNYIFIPPNTYSVEVVPTGTDTVVLQVPNVRLLGSRFYTIYAIGLVGDTPPLQVLIPQDGNSYIYN